MYRDILQPVVSYLETNVQRIKPVIIHDEQRGTIVSQTPRRNYQSIWQHWDKTVAYQAKILRRSLLTAEHDLFSNGPLKAIQSQGTISLQQVQLFFTWYFRLFLPQLIPQAAIARHILEQHKPALIISPDVADPRTRLYCLLGRSLGLSSLELQFGSYGAEGVEWQFLAADQVAVWGEAARMVLAEHGVPDERMIVTGSPRFDFLSNRAEGEKEQTRARLGVPDNKIVVLFASTYRIKAYNAVSSPTRLMEVKKALFKAVNQTESICLVVKPHPLENVHEIKQLAKGSQNVLFADQSSDIRTLIPACDVFITLGSTSTMEALIAHKLVIYPNFPGLVWWNDMYLNNRVVREVCSEEDLARTFQALVDGKLEQLLNELEPVRKRFLSDWVFKLDGQASARVAAVAQHIAKPLPASNPIPA